MHMLQDLRYGLRSARRSPGFAAAAVLLIGLGVAANATIFTVARALVFRPLPFRDPDRLVSLWRQSAQTGAAFGASWPLLADWRRHEHLFQGVAAYIHFRSGSDAGVVSELQVSDEFFPVLGVPNVRGRLFLPRDFQTPAGIDPVVVSHELWTRRPDIVGQFLKVGASTRLVIGALPRGVRMFRDDLPEVYSPLRPFPGHLTDRSMTYLETIARLKPGVDAGRARAELAAYGRRAQQAHPQTDAGFLCRVDDLRERLFGSRRPVMALLLAAVGLVLLIACANVAILLLVRSVRRRPEIAIRAALGAARSRIARQLLAESLVLSLAGCAAGLLLAIWATDLFAAFCLETGIGLPLVRIDAAVVAFTVLISIAAGAFFGAAPLRQVWKVDLNANLKAAGPASSPPSASRVLGGTLAVAEIALSAVLLVGAGLLLRSFVRVSEVDPGFRPEHGLAVSIGNAPRTAGFREREAAFWSELLDRARSLPGIQAAAFCGALPLAAQQAPENMKARIALAGRQLPAPGFLPAEYLDVSPDYFRTLGIPLRRGRTFQDRPEDASAVIVNQAFAREAWGEEDPAGKQITVPGGRPYTVVGVVGDVRQYNLRSAPPRRQIYRPLLRSDVATLSKWPAQYLVVRTSEDPERIAPMLKELVRSIDPERPVISARTLRDLAFRSTAWDRLKMTVVGMFGASALLLALIGLYAVVAHSVSQRRREIGIRIALGGRQQDIRRMVLREGILMVLAGLAIGVLAALALAPLLSDQLFEVAAADLPTLAAVSLLLLATALLACYLPVRTATRIDPVSVLRGD